MWATLSKNWPYLVLSTVIASWIQTYVDQQHLAHWLRRRGWVAVAAAVAVGALTPFCSCGTTAIVLGALASSVPWAPVVAFMASSPLTSPSEFVLSVGLFGSPFALTYLLSSVGVGVLGGLAAWWLERRGLLDGQARMSSMPVPMPIGAKSLGVTTEPPSPSGRSLLALAEPRTRAVAHDLRVRRLVNALWSNMRKVALFFLAFAFVGYLIIRIVPAHFLTEWLGQGNPLWSVPLAALLGVPVYLNSDASLPLVAGLVEGGMSPGAAIAFLTTGAGTSIGSITGMLVIARWRVVALVVATLFVTGVVTGWLAAFWL
ncbi:permease [Tessaracoccus oleiagri]|uniref:permease n=1 Tax=Tessaracoccus oleiagri TaxID=686624 RepID=UPI001FE17FD9|nr:permease [Tessaracoccus oleiagri]